MQTMPTVEDAEEAIEHLQALYDYSFRGHTGGLTTRVFFQERLSQPSAVLGRIIRASDNPRQRALAEVAKERVAKMLEAVAALKEGDSGVRDIPSKYVPLIHAALEHILTDLPATSSGRCGSSKEECHGCATCCAI